MVKWGVYLRLPWDVDHSLYLYNAVIISQDCFCFCWLHCILSCPALYCLLLCLKSFTFISITCYDLVCSCVALCCSMFHLTFLFSQINQYGWTQQCEYYTFIVIVLHYLLFIYCYSFIVALTLYFPQDKLSSYLFFLFHFSDDILLTHSSNQIK